MRRVNPEEQSVQLSDSSRELLLADSSSSGLIQEIYDILAKNPKLSGHEFLRPSRAIFDEDDRLIPFITVEGDFRDNAVKNYLSWRHSSQELVFALRSAFNKLAGGAPKIERFDNSASVVQVLLDGVWLLNEKFPDLGKTLTSLNLRDLNVAQLVTALSSSQSGSVSTLSALSFGSQMLKLSAPLKSYTMQLMQFARSVDSPEIDAKARAFCLVCLAESLGTSRLVRDLIGKLGVISLKDLSMCEKYRDTPVTEVIRLLSDDIAGQFGLDGILDIIEILKNLYDSLSSNTKDSELGSALSNLNSQIDMFDPHIIR